MSLVEELKRRKVLKVGGAYLVLAWLAVQVASIVFPTFAAPVWVLRVFILVLALGFPIAVVMAWLLDVTPEGLRIEPAARGNKRIFGAAIAVAALALAWYFVGQPAMREAPPAQATASAVVAPPVPKGPPARSIAVLPFVDMSQGKDQEYFSDGITEEILNALTRIEGLKVAGRTSSFHFKGRNDSLKDIGAALGVSHVLEGSVRKQGERVRITAQLIKVEDGFHVWSQDFDRKLDDIFAVQDEISDAIAEALSSKLMAGGGGEAKAGNDVDARTYDSYLRARQLLADRDPENLKRASELFLQVTRKAPGFDPAWSGLAKAKALAWNYEGGDAGDERSHLAREAAEKAVALNPRNGEGWSMLALIDASYQWRFAEALVEIRKAIEVAPNDAEVANFAGDVFRLSGSFDEALVWEQRAVELDPLADFNQSDLGWLLISRGRYREAVVAGEHAAHIDPKYWSAHDMMARAYLALGEPDRALAQVEILAKDYPALSNVTELRARVAVAKGDKPAARAYLVQLQERERKGDTLAFVIAMLQAQLGDLDAAAASMALAIELRDPAVPGDSEFVQPTQWPRHPGIQAFFARPEVAPMMAQRRRFASDPVVPIVR
jgi:TolB-like protein/Flp pilus assembly protein TadD